MGFQPPASSALSADQEGLLVALLNAIDVLAANTGVRDPLTFRTRVLLEAVTATNISCNTNQYAGSVPLTGVGVSGAGGPRMTPSNDTIAGTPLVAHNPPNLSLIYTAIAVS